MCCSGGVTLGGQAHTVQQSQRIYKSKGEKKGTEILLDHSDGMEEKGDARAEK